MCGKLKNSSPKSPKAAGSADAPWLVVGLGNPGAQYETTRHNIGYLAVDELLDDLTPMPGTLSAHKRTNSLICQTKIDGRSVIIARARSYMNLSGGAIGALAKFFKIPAEHVIVIHDELDLDPAAVRIKVGGGENGHNGLKSTTQALGTRDYVRIRMGIGRPPGAHGPGDFRAQTLQQTRARMAATIPGGRGGRGAAHREPWGGDRPE